MHVGGTVGKGSRQRPSRVPDRKVDENWERTFRSEMGDFHVSFGSMVHTVSDGDVAFWRTENDPICYTPDE